jgi:Protein of unknown function (DUF2752)
MLVDNKSKKILIIFAIVAGYFLLFFFPHFISNYSFCLFKYVTGIPCPACGSTRATILLFDGEFIKSILLNPLAIITNVLIFLSFLWLIKDVLSDKNEYLDFMKRNWQLKYKIMVAVIILSNWIWNIKKGL